jgi:hypothetical protein
MNTHLPVAPLDYSQRFFNQFNQMLTRYFTRVVSHDEEAPHIILRSPNGSRFTVRVTDGGVLDVTPTGHPP